jgi:hypothetical protein
LHRRHRFQSTQLSKHRAPNNNSHRSAALLRLALNFHLLQFNLSNELNLKHSRHQCCPFKPAECFDHKLLMELCGPLCFLCALLVAFFSSFDQQTMKKTEEDTIIQPLASTTIVPPPLRASSPIPMPSTPSSASVTKDNQSSSNTLIDTPSLTHLLPRSLAEESPLIPMPPPHVTQAPPLHLPPPVHFFLFLLELFHLLN